MGGKKPGVYNKFLEFLKNNNLINAFEEGIQEKYRLKTNEDVVRKVLEMFVKGFPEYYNPTEFDPIAIYKIIAHAEPEERPQFNKASKRFLLFIKYQDKGKEQYCLFYDPIKMNSEEFLEQKLKLMTRFGVNFVVGTDMTVMDREGKPVTFKGLEGQAVPFIFTGKEVALGTAEEKDKAIREGKKNVTIFENKENGTQITISDPEGMGVYPLVTILEDSLTKRPLTRKAQEAQIARNKILQDAQNAKELTQMAKGAGGRIR